MEGQHQLGRDITIDSVHNITITAFETSSPIITCSSPVGLWFSNSTAITITNIAIDNCSNHSNTSGALAFSNISGVLTLDGITVTNSNSRGIVMNNVETVEILMCIFNSNGNGGMEMVDVQDITIKGCSFIHNTAKYGQGEGGGLKIKASSSTCPILSLTHSNFTNNTALYGGGLLIDIQCGNMTVSNSHFSYNTVQRLGGGVRVRLSNGIHYPNFTFIQSTFDHNTVLGNDTIKDEPPGGGGVYMYFTKTEPTTTIRVIECIFNSNNGKAYGGGFAVNVWDEQFIDTVISNSLFQLNSAADYASAIMVIPNTTISDSRFFNNTVTDTSSLHYIGTILLSNPVILCKSRSCMARINSCIFSDNRGTGLFTYYDISVLQVMNTSFERQQAPAMIIRAIHVTMVNVSVIALACEAAISLQCSMILEYDLVPRFNIIITDMKIQNNKGTGLILTSCLIQFNGTNIIANNTANLDGGGILIRGIGNINLLPNAKLVLYNNTAGRYGGGMYIEERFNVNTGYQWYGSTCSFSNYTYICNIHFELNKAIGAGDNIYGGNYFHCWKEDAVTPNRINAVVALKGVPKSWYQPSSKSFSFNQTLSHSSPKPFSLISSPPIAVCLCDGDTVNCSTLSTTNKQVYSGQPFNVTVAVVGLGGGVNSGNFIATTSSDLAGADTNFIANKSCKTFVYTPKLSRLIKNQFNVTLNISNSLISDGYLNVSLTILPCPSGLVLDTDTKSCVCESVITQKVPGIICKVSWMPHPIQYSQNNWIGYYKPLNCTIAHSGCPFDYCVSSSAKFSLNESDLQCNYNRSGILCGQCKPGLSLMLGSNKCYQCSNDWLALIPVFAISGILLVVLLIALNLTVSVGSINGLLFYANVVKLNESAFFPRGDVPVISQFIAWLNLDWGIETCFYNGLDSYWKVMLQFVFPIYLWFLVIVIIIACRYSFKVSRLCGHNTVPVLATLILMSYTKLLHTVTKSLMINTIECGDAKWNVWNVDGNVHYLSGKHIVLFSISLMFLVTGLIYTGLVFSSQWLQRYSGKCCKSTRDPVVKLKPLIDAYTGPYKDRYRFWMGLGLIVRILLTVIFTFTSEKSSLLNNNFFIALTVILAIIGSRVYRNKYNAVIETFSYINLFILALVATYINDGKSVSMASTISVTLEIFSFLVIIVVHFLTALKGLFEQRGRRYNRKRQYMKNNQRNYGSFIEDILSPGCQIQQREALIYDD